MKITAEELKAIIRQELNKFIQDYGLEAEPIDNEEPPELFEANQQSKVKIASKLINQMTDDEKDKLFRHYARFTWKTLLARFAEMKSAEKGTK